MQATVRSIPVAQCVVDAAQAEPALRGTTQQARTVLLRNVLIRTPEARLMVDVIVMAIMDGKSPRAGGVASSEHIDAVQFFFDGRSDAFADAVGLEREFVREVAMKCGVVETVKSAA